MKENTNNALIINSLVLYAKMIITTICSLLITRFALQALGVVDFGLYTVLGGIISFIAIFNTIMISTSNRFLAVAIGKGDIKGANVQFNVCLMVHIAIAVITMAIGVPIGNWYVNNFINYSGDINDALMVFNISICGSILSFIGIPYNGLLMAKERFMVFSSVDIVAHLIKLFIAYLLINYFENKLFVYTVTQAFLTVAPMLVYWLYCKLHFEQIVSFKFIKEKEPYKEIFNFSAWVSIGAITLIGKNQGAALLINAFFNTIMNTALGIANSISAYIQLFAQNITQPMAPQITKSYAAGQQERTKELLVMSTKFSFLMMFLISTPFLVAPKWIINLWLGEIPPFVDVFIVLLIVDNLVQSLNAGISNVIFASGKISLYQIVISILNILSILLAFIALYIGFSAESLIYTYILVSIVKFFMVQFVLNHTIHYDGSILVKQSYIPSMIIVFMFLPMLFLQGCLHPILLIVLAFVYTLICVYKIGLDKRERSYILGIVKKTFKR